MAGETVYWEDLKEGDEIPDFPCEFSASKLFQLSAVTQNVHRIHYDRDWAEHEGYEERVIHGPFHGEVIIQTLESWVGITGWVKKVEFSNRRYAVVSDSLTGRGKITRLYEQDGQHRADLEVWAEKGPDEVTAPGTATVVLPTRDQPLTIPR